MSRRRILTLGLLGVPAAAIAAGGGVGGVIYARLPQSNVGELGFATPLAIPDQLTPRIDRDGRLVFDLEITAGISEFVAGIQTPTWGLNGPYLGPTLRASYGDEVLVNVSNRLPEPTTLHWHGMHLPGAMDGGPHQMIAPGQTWSPTWRIDQPAATLWFHPHLHRSTAEHVYRGLSGMFLLDDPKSQALDLPATYGVDDIPVIIQDKAFHEDGTLHSHEPIGSQVGVLGDTILVNGTFDPYFDATTTLVRLRVLNASNARIYGLGFTDDRPYWLIGTDSGLLETPGERTRLQLSPGERAELVVELSPGEQATLRSFPPDLGMNPLFSRMNGGSDTFDILQIHAADQLAQSPPLPADLVPVDRPDEASASNTRQFELEGFSRINGKAMDLDRIDEVVTVGSTEIWEIRSTGNTYHNFHVHDIHFAVLDIDGQPPPPELQGWKDTVFVTPGSTVRIIARFEDYPDPDAPYMFHCHILMHEDMGMMGQFVIVEPDGT
jgi:FtsP/CotA-like multicopper oxidase with cupredoxin domain